MTILVLLSLALFVTGALLVMLATVIHNLWAFPRLSAKLAPKQQPRVSVLIPARNEAATIGATVTALLRQQYPIYEVIVLDDHSEDETSCVAKAAAANNPKFRLLVGQPLPAGWSGKNWACHQLAQAAQFDLLLFTDADVQWQPLALNAAIALQQAEAADLLTVWPTQITVTWGERLVVPLMSFAIWAYLPVWLAHHTPYPSAAAANGQCLLFRRAAYERCGGHAAVRNRVLDDVLLAQRVKATGGRLRMADGAALIACRMYHSWRETYFGYAKNILAGHNGSPLFLGASTIFHLLTFVGPWLWLAWGIFVDTPYWPLWPLTLLLLGLLLRFLAAHATGQRLGDAFLMPLSVLLMTGIALQSLRWYWHGGPQWKGRILPNG